MLFSAKIKKVIALYSLCLAVFFIGHFANAAQESEGHDILLAIVTVSGSAQDIVATRFKDLLEERSDSRFRVEISREGVLGSETEILELVRMNAVQMAIITTEPIEAFVPEAALVGFPFMFRDHQQADEILDGPLGREILDSLKKAGFKGIHFSENGFRHLTNNVRPVHDVDDVQGMVIRVMETPLHRELWTILGAHPSPLPWPIDDALMSGRVDGQENPLWVPSVYKFHRFQKYLSLTGHVYSSHVDLANLTWFNSLSQEDQELITMCMRDAAVYQRAYNRSNEARYLKGLKEHGMVVNDSPDIESFRNRALKLKDLPIYSTGRVRDLLVRMLEATEH